MNDEDDGFDIRRDAAADWRCRHASIPRHHSSFLLPPLGLRMYWLILGCTIPSMVVCWAAAFAVRRWGRGGDWSIGRAIGKSTTCPCPPAADWPSGWASCCRWPWDKLLLWGLAGQGSTQSPIGRHCESTTEPLTSMLAGVRRPVRARPAAPVGQALGTAGRRDGAHAAGTGRRSPRAGLAAAAWACKPPWPWCWWRWAGE